MKKRFQIAIIGLLLAACGNQSAPESAAVDVGQQQPTPPSCELTLGWDPWEPYQYAAVDGSISGLDIELASLLAGDAGCELRYKRGEWGDLLSSLRSGDVDLLLAGTPLEERREYAWFSDPYRNETFAVFVRSEDREQLADMSIREIAEAGHRIGLTSGYFYSDEVNQMAYDGELANRFLAAPVVDLNYWRLLDGTVDAILADPIAMSAFKRRKGLEDRLAKHSVTIDSGQVSLMFSRASVDEDIVLRFNKALAERRQNGTIERLLNRYGSG